MNAEIFAQYLAPSFPSLVIRADDDQEPSEIRIDLLSIDEYAQDVHGDIFQAGVELVLDSHLTEEDVENVHIYRLDATTYRIRYFV
jgi:hypothetical protein